MDRQIRATRIVVAFLLRVALFRERGAYLEVWNDRGERHLTSLFSIGEELISYLVSVGAIDGEGCVGRSRMTLDDIEPTIDRLVDAAFDSAEAVRVLVCHFSEDHFSPDRFELFRTYPESVTDQRPQISESEVAALLSALEELGYVRRLPHGYLITSKMLPAMKSAYIRYYLTEIE